jgi:type I restriction enzyme S subunit
VNRLFRIGPLEAEDQHNFWTSFWGSGHTGSLIKGLKVPFPPFKEQARIAGILDKFDTLTNSVYTGLPRELELRQKQFEYYRDLLLSFPKSDAQEA